MYCFALFSVFDWFQLTNLKKIVCILWFKNGLTDLDENMYTVKIYAYTSDIITLQIWKIYKITNCIIQFSSVYVCWADSLSALNVIYDDN